MGTGDMARATPRTARRTRNSTRSQTQKSYQISYVRKKPLKAKDTGRVDKTRPNPTSKPESKASVTTDTIASGKSSDAPARSTTFSITSDLVNKPIICHQYTPTTQKKSNKSPSHFIFTHGAGGTLSAPAVVNFCTGFASVSQTPLLAFQGSSNLGARAKGFLACHKHLHGEVKGLVLGGRSMGARAAVAAATEMVTAEKKESTATIRLVLISYPLQGPKDVRDQILLDLPEGMEVLFIAGDRDAMCPLELLEEVRGKMGAKSRLIVVKGADHGMNVKPVSRTKEMGEETGKVAARWLSGDIESDGETLYVGDEE